MGIYTIGSIGCGLSFTAAKLIVLRIVQRIGSAMIFATGLAIITSGHPVRLVFNHTKPPFDERRVRHALAYAINRPERMKISQGQWAELAMTGGISRATPWHADDLPTYACDPAKAWQLLQQAGFGKDAQGRITLNGKPWEIELLLVKHFEGDGAILAHQLEKQGRPPGIPEGASI